MITRHMTITRAPGTENTPMVKIANRALDAMGFNIGSKIAVAYEPERNVISISLRTNYEQRNLQEADGIALSAKSAASGRTHED